MKYSGLIKLLIVIFIIVALFNYRWETLNEWAIKTGLFLRGFGSSDIQKDSAVQQPKSNLKTQDKVELHKEESMKASPKVSPTDDSLVSGFVANVINKLLDTPNGQILFKETLASSAAKSSFGQERDFMERKYFAVDSEQGKGNVVRCGDKVEISYVIQNRDGNQNSQDKRILNASIVVGLKQLPQPLENALIGMNEGGKRKVVYIAEDPFAYQEVKSKHGGYSKFVSEVSLKKVHSFNPHKDQVRVFVNNPSRIGKRVLCGDSVLFVYKVFDLENNMLSKKDHSNRVVLNVNKDPKNSLRSIYNNIVDTYKDHVNVTAIMTYKQAKQLLPGFKNESKKLLSEDSLVIVDLSGMPSASAIDWKAHHDLNNLLSSK